MGVPKGNTLITALANARIQIPTAVTTSSRLSSANMRAKPKYPTAEAVVPLPPSDASAGIGRRFAQSSSAACAMPSKPNMTYTAP